MLGIEGRRLPCGKETNPALAVVSLTGIATIGLDAFRCNLERGNKQMQILVPGHVFGLQVYDEKGEHEAPLYLRFINKEKTGGEWGDLGTRTQEVIRALISRTEHCHKCQPHELNSRIVYHLRMALIMHEMRALQQKMLKGSMKPEDVVTGADGHFLLEITNKGR